MTHYCLIYTIINQHYNTFRANEFFEVSSLSILNIRTLPDPLLRQKAKRVQKIDTSVRQLVADMIDTMRDANGVGLAANQVGVLKRVVVIEIPGEDQVRVLINPEIVRREGEREIEEGCLSIPGYRGELKRSVKVRARALDVDGKPIRVKADGLLAQALEHETDHINGILYVDHLEDHQKLYRLEYHSSDEDNDG